VRLVAKKAGIETEELEFSNDKARCCGWGGHIISGNRKFAETVIKNRISETTHPYITYCTNCRDTFALRGKECVHILDLLFGLNGRDFIPPTPGEKRTNRLMAKNSVLTEVFGENGVDTAGGQCDLELKISPEMKAKLSRLFILEEEVCETIKYLEETKNSVYNVDADTYIGYLLIGIITYWVEYRKLGDGEFELINAYTHRVQIDEEIIKG